MPNRDDVVRILDHMLAEGWRISGTKGHGGPDWQNLTVEMRRPVASDHTHREVIGGARDAATPVTSLDLERLAALQEITKPLADIPLPRPLIDYRDGTIGIGGQQ